MNEAMAEKETKHLSYKDLSHPIFLDNIRSHNATTLKLVRTGECNDGFHTYSFVYTELMMIGF